MGDPQPPSAFPNDQSDRAEPGAAARRERAPKADRIGRVRHQAALQRLHRALRAGLVRSVSDDSLPLESWESEDIAEESPDGTAELTRPEGDDLPEHTLYRDDGCHVAPACLTCPLPACIFDRTLSPAQHARRGRNRRIRALSRKGWSSARLADRFALSPAQVRRIRAGRRQPHRNR